MELPRVVYPSPPTDKLTIVVTSWFDTPEWELFFLQNFFKNHLKENCSVSSACAI